MRFIRSLTVLAVACGAFAVSAPAHAATGRYAALGDSYTAGPLVPNQILAATGCLRSDHNYPHVVASAIGASAFADASRSGATTKDMTQAQSVIGGTNPPQLNSVTAATQIVTLGIGGNDIGFSSIIENCASILPFGSPCKDQYVNGSNDTIANRINTTAPKVASVLDAIHARAPGARVFVVGYPAILPNSGSGCWPSMPIAWNDVPYLRNKEKQLNSMLAAQSAAHGATYVDTYTPSIGHDSCTGTGTRWVEPIVPGNAAAPVHPNARGEQGMANAVRAAIG